MSLRLNTPSVLMSLEICLYVQINAKLPNKSMPNYRIFKRKSQITEQIDAKLPKKLVPNYRILRNYIIFVAPNRLIYGWLQT